MNNKTLGALLIIICILFGIVFFLFDRQLNQQAEAACGCAEMEEGGFCPHQQQTSWLTYFGVVMISALAALGIYLIFFEKSQKAIVSVLEKQKHIQTEQEKFDILLKGLDTDEKNVVKAVKDQDGITQQTLRLRTGLHKSKLSIVLDRLEKKGLIARQDKGKTKEVFLKVGV